MYRSLLLSRQDLSFFVNGLHTNESPERVAYDQFMRMCARTRTHTHAHIHTHTHVHTHTRTHAHTHKLQKDKEILKIKKGKIASLNTR